VASRLNDAVRAFWERGPVGTDARITGALAPRSPEWFAQVEENRYAKEPFIHAVAQFTRHRGERLLEIGVGAGSDHLQWARAGCVCHGVDLTDAAIETTRAHLALHGLASDLRRVDAETLPFADASFDVVWSWGVIHHSERPERIIAEIHRVLRPDGVFLGMLYNRHSLAVLAEWVKHALLAGRPWRSFADVLWHHFESVGTKAYTPRELEALFAAFSTSEITTYMTPYDLQHWPRRVAGWFPQGWGMFHAIRARK
jgi:2-polyprenyl-3-methyl-5-hydroxy-6-metoxy-1,4-benzoquinol methylase